MPPCPAAPSRCRCRTSTTSTARRWAVSGRARAGGVRAGLFLGRGAKFWQQPGVYTTAVGYARGPHAEPDLREVCSGMTGHTEVVLVVFDPKKVSLRRAAEGVLGEPRSDAGHAPGQRRRHAVPLGHLLLRRRAARGGRALARRLPGAADAAGYGRITTEICRRAEFYYAEDYHQQYLAKNPDGYCGLGGTGVSCPVGVEVH